MLVAHFEHYFFSHVSSCERLCAGKYCHFSNYCRQALKQKLLHSGFEGAHGSFHRMSHRDWRCHTATVTSRLSPGSNQLFVPSRDIIIKKKDILSPCRHVSPEQWFFIHFEALGYSARTLNSCGPDSFKQAVTPTALSRRRRVLLTWISSAWVDNRTSIVRLHGRRFHTYLIQNVFHILFIWTYLL